MTIYIRIFLVREIVPIYVNRFDDENCFLSILTANIQFNIIELNFVMSVYML